MNRRALGLTLILSLAGTLLFPAGDALAGELAKARGLMESESYPEAIRILERFTRTFPSEPRGWALLADCYQRVMPPMVDEAGVALARKDSAQNKRIAMLATFTALESASTFERLVADEPQDVQNNLLLGAALLLHDQDIDAARKQLEKTGRLGVPNDLMGAYSFAWGLYYLEAKEWENARKAFNNAKRTNSYALGKLQEVDRLEAAQSKEWELAANDPARIAEKRFGELMTEARTMVREDRHETAVDLLEEALRLNSGDPEAQTMLAESRVRASLDLYWEGKKHVDLLQYVESWDKFERALKLDPTNASASLALEHVKKKVEEQGKPQVIRRYIPATGSPPVEPPQ